MAAGASVAADWPEDGPEGAQEPRAAVPRGVLTPELREALCGLVSAGRSVPKAIAACGVSESVFWKWHAEDVEFRAAVQAARTLGVEKLADEIIEIAEEKTDPRHRQVRIDARKWLLSKLLPRRYGDKLDLNVGQRERDEHDYTDAELAAIVAEGRRAIAEAQRSAAVSEGLRSVDDPSLDERADP